MKGKTIGIFTYQIPGQSPWDPDSIQSGITGSEEAVIYMSKELARLGYCVLVFGNPPALSPHSLESANPRFVSSDFVLAQQLDIAIAWRSPLFGSFLKAKGVAKRIYLWPHDTLEEPASIEGFDGVLWLSKWQRQQWLSLSPSFARFTEIFGNGIDPNQFQTPRPRENPYSCIYGSNYAGGLEILLKIWSSIKERFPRATLDIYYGWQHWGLLAPQVESWMRDEIKRLPDVIERGQVGHEELNRAYAKASFWVYPCIRPETFCITALRAQLSGAVPVILEGSALKETVRSGFRCQRVEEYLPLFFRAMALAEAISLEDRSSVGKRILLDFSWEKLGRRFQKLFSSL